MTGFEAALREGADHLTRAGVRFALIGGLAVSARTEPRFTRDADLAVAVRSDVEAEAVVRDLRHHHYEVDTVVEQSAVGRLATVRLRRHTGSHAPVLDLLFASSGIEPEIVQAAEILEVLPDLRIPVAGIGHLIALKVLSRDDLERPQDVVDLRALLKVATQSDRDRAREALRLITSRGFNRSRDLLAALAALAPSR